MLQIKKTIKKQAFNTATNRIILAILDWGLGHASRCVSLVRQWQLEGKEVFIVCSGSSYLFMKEECPKAHYLEWEGYAIRYPTSSMVVNLAWQSIHVVKVIRNEHRQMKKWVTEIQPDLIVSDGRFGCHHPNVKSIWMAHQLQIQHSFRPFAWVLNVFYYRFIKKNHQAVWVPDYEGDQSLAGQLSLSIPGIPHRYLGPLSRYSTQKTTQHSLINKKYRWLALLSGPEPQRSYFEQELITLLEKTNEPCLLIRGITGESQITSSNGKLQIINCLYGDELNTHIMAADQLICRSGYSTLLDLHFWQKPAILVPTPGQTEQIYLAEYWKEKAWAVWQEQGSVKLE